MISCSRNVLSRCPTMRGSSRDRPLAGLCVRTCLPDRPQAHWKTELTATRSFLLIARGETPSTSRRFSAHSNRSSALRLRALRWLAKAASERKLARYRLIVFRARLSALKAAHRSNSASTLRGAEAESDTAGIDSRSPVRAICRSGVVRTCSLLPPSASLLSKVGEEPTRCSCQNRLRAPSAIE